MSRRDKEGRDSCPRSGLMRRRVVRSELPPRFRTETCSISKTFGLLLFRLLRGHLPLKGKAWGLRRTTKGFPLRGSCRRSRLMRRRVVRFELPPRFGSKTRCISKAFGLLLFRRFAPPSPHGEGFGSASHKLPRQAPGGAAGDLGICELADVGVVARQAHKAAALGAGC